MPPGVERAGASPIRRSDEHEDERLPAPAARPRQPAEPSLCRGAALDAELDRAVLDACRNASAPKPNDRILYVGMNEDSAAREGAALRATGAGVASIEANASGEVVLGGVAYDMNDDVEVERFSHAVAAKYGLGPEQEDALFRALRDQSGDGRDELARIALAWAPGEAGQAIPSRLVLSGHQAGDRIGGTTSHLSFDSLRALARALPNAAKQIEDVHFSGCFTERQVNDPAKWQAVFPSLRTMWGYAGFSPLAPVAHLVAWEQASRGRADVIRGSTVAPHEAAVAWSRRGEVVGQTPSLAERRAARDRADASYDAYVKGERKVSDPYAPGARNDYAAQQQIAASSDASPEERARATARAAVMFRVRFYEKSVRGAFAREHGATIASACRQLGIEAPDLATLSRKDALAAVRAFEAKLDALPRPVPPDVSRAAAALRGLAELREDVIKTEWCH